MMMRWWWWFRERDERELHKFNHDPPEWFDVAKTNTNRHEINWVVGSMLQQSTGEKWAFIWFGLMQLTSCGQEQQQKHAQHFTRSGVWSSVEEAKFDGLWINSLREVRFNMRRYSFPHVEGVGCMHDFALDTMAQGSDNSMYYHWYELN
jgi:hypothetical protein